MPRRGKKERPASLKYKNGTRGWGGKEGKSRHWQCRKKKKKKKKKRPFLPIIARGIGSTEGGGGGGKEKDLLALGEEGNASVRPGGRKERGKKLVS